MGGTQTTGGLQKKGQEPNHGGPCTRGNKGGARAALMRRSPQVVSRSKTQINHPSERKACALVRVLLLFPGLERPAVLGAGHPRTFTFPSAIK